MADTREEYEAHEDAFEVRDYQLEAWANLWDARKEGKKRGLVHLATGLGKTSVAVFDVMKFREEQMAQDPPVVPRILFVSHMNDISEQAHERFKHFMPDLETAYFKTGKRDIPDADITFATFQSLHSELDRFDPQDYEYIIYDEAHHSEANTFREVRDYFDPLFELAITATPGRMDDRDIKKYFGEALYSKTLAEGIAEGWLADVDYHIVFDDIVKQLMEDGFEPKTLKEFHELFKVRPRNEVIAKNIREERHKIGLDTAKTMVFCEDVAHADEMAELLGGVAYHSGLKKDERKQILKDYREGKIKVICTVDMFNEGIDIPDARLVVFLRSTQSGNIFEQQLGRGLRRARGKDKVSVLDFVANIERIAKVRELSNDIGKAKGGQSGTDGTDGKPIVDIDKDKGIQIKTSHGSFDFDKVAIDLLSQFEKLGGLFEPAPADMISIAAAADELEISHGRLNRFVEQMGWDLPVYRFTTRVGRGLNAQQMQLLRDKIEETDRPFPQDHMTLNNFAEYADVSRPTVEKLINRLGLELTTHRVTNNREAQVLTPLQQDLLLKEPELSSPRAPEGYMTETAFTKSLGIDHSRLRSMMRRLGVEARTYRFKTNLGPGISPAQQVLIKESLDSEEDAPQGYVTINAFVKAQRIAEPTLFTILHDLNISLKEFRDAGGRNCPMLSPDQQRQALEHPTLKDRAPEGVLAIRAFAKKHGMSWSKAKRITEYLKLDLNEYQFKTGRSKGLTPQDQFVILEFLRQGEPS